ncbi:MAG: hypothetical protein EOO09_19105 [Chitinophagaceae bacterium]|nr:MAG: hypothetical protein EOO09_19105 [Chitinophagaceae bacterium]
MFESLRSHPFAVNAFFNHSLVLTYALPVEDILPLIPAPLEPDLFHGKWGFVAAAFVQTSALRPKGFPVWMGNDFLLAGYRVFVRYRNLAGHRLRGLYILASQTDSARMQRMGNFFTRYSYTTDALSFTRTDQLLKVQSGKTGLSVIAGHADAEPALPAGSPFADWKEARRFAGPMPFTFSVINKSTVVVVEGVRSNWTPRPVSITADRIPFLDNSAFRNRRLANAFVVEDIPYSWKKGVVEKW